MLFQLQWTSETDTAFANLMVALQQLLCLSLPDPTKPFVQIMCDKFLISVTCPVAEALQLPATCSFLFIYTQSSLGRTAALSPRCCNCRGNWSHPDIVDYALLTLLVPHEVPLLLLEWKTHHFSAACQLHYTTPPLEKPNIRVQRCIILNPATHSLMGSRMTALLWSTRCALLLQISLIFP